MKTPSRTSIKLLLALGAIALVVALVRNRNGLTTPRSESSSADAPGLAHTAEVTSPAAKGAQQGLGSNDVREVRGAGYNWGAALKTVYAGAKIAPNGKTQLDVTALEKSFKGFASPVDLSNASEAPKMRAEYLASTLTAALDLDASHQPALAAILEAYYRTDSNQWPLEFFENPGTQSRSELCQQARVKLATALPADVQEQFQEIFGSPNFLFETMSVAAEVIELEKNGRVVVTSGDAVFGIFGNGSVFMNGNSSSSEAKQPR